MRPKRSAVLRNHDWIAPSPFIVSSVQDFTARQHSKCRAHSQRSSFRIFLRYLRASSSVNSFPLPAVYFIHLRLRLFHQLYLLQIPLLDVLRHEVLVLFVGVFLRISRSETTPLKFQTSSHVCDLRQRGRHICAEEPGTFSFIVLIFTVPQNMRCAFPSQDG